MRPPSLSMPDHARALHLRALQPLAGLHQQEEYVDLGELDEPQSQQGHGVLGPVSTLRKAEEWQFVLRAVNIPGLVERTPEQQFVILVPAELAARAAREVTAYESENAERRREKAKRDEPLYGRSYWALAIVLMLAAFFAATGPVRSSTPFFNTGIADAGKILHGHVYQSVTALTLHADTAHLMGNAIVGAMFLTIVHRRFGAGLGTLLVVVSGAAGNIINAAWHHGMHRSLGASTAVMAAIAIVAVTQFVLNRERERKRGLVRTWGPIVGGLALLGMFGASPNSDLHAHGFGFLAGLVIGGAIAFPLRKRTVALPRSLQIAFGGLSAIIVAGSWVLALHFGGA